MRILHIVPGLNIGGAEIVLRNLVLHPQSAQHINRVVCIGRPGIVGTQLEQYGIPVDYLNVQPTVPLSLTRLVGLKKLVTQFQPDLIQSWMYHANLLTTLFVTDGTPVVWALHQDLSDTSWIKPLTGIIMRIGAWASKYPVKIISVSQRAVESHAALGYAQSKFVVIPNGFTVEEPIADKNLSIRDELGLSKGTPLLGYFARYHPMKDHANFLAAAEIVHREMPGVHFLLAGRGVQPDNASLTEGVATHQLADVVHLLGERNDVSQLLRQLDVYSTSSRSEGFPLAVGEAMAAGIPCVVTDVGDSGRLVGDTGLVVPSRNPQALAEAWLTLLRTSPADRKARGRAASERIRQHFSLDKMVSDYYSLYAGALDEATHPRPAE